MEKMFFALFLAVILNGSALAAGPAVGEPAPNLIGRNLEGKLYRLFSDEKKPKVINFFSVTCKPCKAEMPELAGLEKKYPGVKFISVNTDEISQEKVAEFVKSLSGVPSTIVLTGAQIKEVYLYTGLPHTVVMDSQNIVKLNIAGYDGNIKTLEDAIKTVLAGK